MLRFLPVGWMGLMLGGLIAANSSTILTHLNWGASYLVHDFYRRFLKPGESEKHYVIAGRLATVLLFVASSALVFALDTAKQSFNLILADWRRNRTALSYALVLVARDRVVRDCSYVQLVRYFGCLSDSGQEWCGDRHLSAVALHGRIHHGLLDHDRLSGPPDRSGDAGRFYRKVHPFGPGWRRVRALAGISAAQAAAWSQHENIPLSLLGWSTGCVMIWSALFSVGTFFMGARVTRWRCSRFL